MGKHLYCLLLILFLLLFLYPGIYLFLIRLWRLSSKCGILFRFSFDYSFLAFIINLTLNYFETFLPILLLFLLHKRLNFLAFMVNHIPSLVNLRVHHIGNRLQIVVIESKDRKLQQDLIYEEIFPCVVKVPVAFQEFLKDLLHFRWE